MVLKVVAPWWQKYLIMILFCTYIEDKSDIVVSIVSD